MNKILPVDILKLIRLKYTYQDIKNYSISKLPLIVRCAVLSLACIFLILIRFAIMGFSKPTFQREDNPTAFLANSLLRLVNYNYIYSLNLWLLLCPDWLCFDWSMGCIPLINSIDPRLSCIVVFWLMLSLFIKVIFSRKDHQLIRYILMQF